MTFKSPFQSKLFYDSKRRGALLQKLPTGWLVFADLDSTSEKAWF